jgi:hypothetical protein
MKRSAVFAGAVAAAIGSVDCSSSSSTPGAGMEPHDSGRADVVAAQPDYGIAVPYDAAHALPPPDAGAGDAETDVLTVGQAYGTPGSLDAGHPPPADAGERDAGRDVVAVGTDYGIAMPYDAGHAETRDSGKPDVVAGGTDYGIPGGP